MRQSLSYPRVLHSDWLWLAARLLLSTVFLCSGLLKLWNFEAGRQEVQNLGLAPPALWNGLVVLCLLGCSLLIVLDRYLWLASAALVAFLALAILLVHHFWSLPPMRAAIAMNVALEHISLMGGLVAAAIASATREALRAGR